MKIKKGSKFRYKMLAANMIIVSTLIILLFIIFISYYIHIQNKHQQESLDNICVSIGSQLDNRFIMMERIALQISTNYYIQEILQLRQGDTDQFNFYRKNPQKAFQANELIWSYILNDDVASRIILYNEYGDMICTGQKTDSEKEQVYISKSRIELLEEKFTESNAHNIYQYCKTDELVEESSSNMKDGYVSVTRKIQKVQSKAVESLGYVEVQLSIANIEKSLKKFLVEQNIVMLDGEGNPICTVGAEKSGDEAKNQSYAQLEESGFSIILSDYKRLNAEFVISTFVLMSFLILLLIIVLYLIQKKVLTELTKPLINLCEQVKISDMVNWNEIPLEEQAEDEIVQLHTSFGKMMKELNYSMNELLIERTSKLQTQMLALQAQVNPHFIHNTLSVIVALAQGEECEKVEDISNRLSDMIRYGADYTTTDIPIQVEIEQTCNYLELIKARYEENFKYNIDAFSKELHFTIPKFVVQPILENALEHSLKKKAFPWIIEVKCYVQEKHWIIEISDNGMGVTREKIEEIQARVEKTRVEEVDYLLKQIKIGGYSLLNTVTRLYIAYNNEMVFEIKSNDRGGTSVTIGGCLY